MAQFKRAAEMARRAGFDGVEVHGANGYIIDQFLRDGSNRRDDAYGGSAQKRMRLLSEVLDAVCEVWSSSRVGVRLSPENSFNSMSDSDPRAHFMYFVEQLGRRGLAYLHVLEGDMMTRSSVLDYAALRERFGGTYIANNGYDLDLANARLAEDQADLIAFGRAFIGNPDLVERLKQGAPLSAFNPATLYGGGAAGYIDYPTLAESSVSAS